MDSLKKIKKRFMVKNDFSEDKILCLVQNRIHYIKLKFLKTKDFEIASKIHIYIIET